MYDIIYVYLLFGGLNMTVKEIIDILDGHMIYGEDLLDREVFTACGSDMMSDVLAFVKEQAVLLTGLVNPQDVRTAVDAACLGLEIPSKCMKII